MRRIVIAAAIVIVLAGITVGYFSISFRRHNALGRYHHAMQTDLRNLAAMQEVYYATHNSYASDACADGTLCATLGVTASTRISLTTTGSEKGWSAVATHAALPNERCDIHAGDAPSPGVSTEPDQVACTPFWP